MGLFGKKAAPTEQAANHEVTLESGEAITISAVVDCIGDSCPRPQLMTRGALGKAGSGDAIEVKVDNPTSMEALPSVITENGGAHLGTVRQGRHWQVIARKV